MNGRGHCVRVWVFSKTGQMHRRAHEYTQVVNAQIPTSPYRGQRWCGKGDVTLIWEMMQKLISTRAASHLPHHHHHHHIHHTHNIHQLLSEIKQDKHAIERQ